MQTSPELDHQSYSGGEVSRAFISRLVQADSDLGHQLRRAASLPLRDYLRSLIPVQPGAHNLYREYAAQALASYLHKRQYENIDYICDHLLRVPVIQQADHSNLLLDQETFLNNFLFAQACREANVELMITSQCSTVSCFSRRDPVAGPVFLRTRGRLYKVFPFSKRTFKNSSFCALPAPITMSFEALEGNEPTADLDPFLRRFQGRAAESAPEAYRKCNDEIWGELDATATVRRIAVDESMTSELAALHIRDAGSPVYRLLFDQKVRACFLSVKRLLVASPKNLAVNQAIPDFFWYRKETRLVPAILLNEGVQPHLVLASDGQRAPIAYSPEAIAQALRDGILYVDRILAYLVRCLLPDIVAVGGTSQQDYVALYRQMILESHHQQPFLEQSDLDRIKQPGCSRLGGAPLLELRGPELDLVARLDETTALKTFAEAFLDEPVGKTIGTLRCAHYLDPVNAHVLTS